MIVQLHHLPMSFAHERLDLYQLSLAFVSWSQRLSVMLPAKGPIRGQLERASTSIPLNIAEGNAKASKKDRAKYLRVALGSTYECAAILDVLIARGSADGAQVLEGKETLERVSAMIVALLRGLGSTLPD
jgi:four helix bundle protein